MSLRFEKQELEGMPEDRVKLLANDMMLKSKAFFLAVVSAGGKMQYLDYTEELNDMELLGYKESLAQAIESLFKVEDCETECEEDCDE